VVLVPAMSDYSSMLRSYWMMEEEDDDMHFLLDDDEAEVATYNLLVEAESSHTRRRSDAPPKVIRPRDLPSGHKRINADYFVPNPVYNDKQFRRRFRMFRPLFKCIKEAVKNHDDYFKKKCDDWLGRTIGSPKVCRVDAHSCLRTPGGCC